jgi:hypothetical protein
LDAAVADGTGYLALGMDKNTIPSGGIINFKGATTTPVYVVQKCTSIAPHYSSTNK